MLLASGGPGGLPCPYGVELHLLVSAVLAAEGRVASVHEDVPVAAKRLAAEGARVQRREAVLAYRLGVEEEGGGERRGGHGFVVGLVACARQALVTGA